jgi:hypothetical protein
MSDRLVAVNFSNQAQVAAANVHRVKLPVSMTLVGVSLQVEGLTGSPTNVKFQFLNGATEIIAATKFTLTAAGVAEWLTAHFAGAEEAVALGRGDTLNVTLSFTGGSTPGADYDITLWMLAGTR